LASCNTAGIPLIPDQLDQHTMIAIILLAGSPQRQLFGLAALALRGQQVWR
jgi:hypothetical protein